jgi:hypothetical protein
LFHRGECLAGTGLRLAAGDPDCRKPLKRESFGDATYFVVISADKGTFAPLFDRT